VSDRPHNGRAASTAGESPRRSRLAVEIGVVLALKFAALVAIWSLWFDGRQERRPSGEDVARTIYAAPAPKAAGGTGHAAGP
jgi:hypothetical protein